WREFYQSILFHFPQVSRLSFREKYRKIKWINDPGDFAAWKNGQTGYPIVDAAMRQMNETGWMHNRLRMIAASFLTKDLLIDWRWGEQYFMQQLVDGDSAANNGGWQWSAGTGTDAAPYFRIFNPTTQASKFDPEGKFIRQWVPELHKVVVQYIYEPWTMPLDVQRKTDCMIGKDYPSPMVDHKWARQRTLHFYKEASL
ncbi:MAG: deoxyribodipyrimidine photo-lyase, partial [Anaerolineae bacterium]|nr:deoxyribodipyrimidine photo-lyase [Anaerolineae bacterium]